MTDAVDEFSYYVPPAQMAAHGNFADVDEWQTEMQLKPMRSKPEDTEVVVRTEVRGRGEPIQLDYRLEKTDASRYRLTADLASSDAVLTQADITNMPRLGDETLVVNDPRSVINAPEKMFVLDFARFMPPTLVARRIEVVEIGQQVAAGAAVRREEIRHAAHVAPQAEGHRQDEGERDSDDGKVEWGQVHHV